MEGSHRQLGRWIDTPEYHSQLGLLRLHVYKNLRCLASRIFSIKQNQTKPKTATKTETKTNSPKTNQTNKQQQQQQQEKEKKIPKKQKNKAQRNWSDISAERNCNMPFERPGNPPSLYGGKETPEV